jgi:NAD(P)H-dependent FMN reductase
MAARILAFAASTRRESFNRKLIRVAAQGAREAGAEVTLLELGEYPVPIYNGDDEKEKGLPPVVRKLEELFRSHNGYLVSSPEYNGGMPGLLKNTLDWLTRPGIDGAPFGMFTDKPVAIMAASPGRFGGARMLPLLRQYLGHLQMLVLPQLYGLAKAGEAFDDDGRLKDSKIEGIVKGLGEKVAKLAAKLAT